MQIKRIYDKPAASDGYRVLVDRLWPRGVSKEKAAVDLWLKDIAPTAELREWFGHKPERFPEFSTLYRKELSNNPTVQVLQQILNQHPTVTLLYAAKDTTHNQAVVLAAYLNS